MMKDINQIKNIKRKKVNNNEDERESETVQVYNNVLARAVRIANRHITEPKFFLDYEDNDSNYESASDYVPLQEERE